MASLDMAARLSVLIQLDIDATNAYEQAIPAIGKTEIRDELAAFKRDHERHIEQLSAVIRALDAEPPERRPDLKGVLAEGFTAIQAAQDPEGALVAMRNNEDFAVSKYREAYEQGFTPNIGELVARNYQDEVRHLRYIEAVLASRLWEE